MTAFQRTHAWRVAKIIEHLEVIEASAKERGATPAELLGLLAPALAKLGVTYQ